MQSFDDFIEKCIKLSLRKQIAIPLLEIVNMCKILMFYDFSIICRSKLLIFLANLETKNTSRKNSIETIFLIKNIVSDDANCTNLRSSA